MMGHVNTQTDQYTHFVYDTKGERILKGSINTASLSTNGQSQSLSLTMDPYTLYLNPFYVAVQRNQVDQVSKHYYYNGHPPEADAKTGFYLAPISPPGPMNSMGNNTLAKNLEATITELGFTDSLSWSSQSASAPDTNVAHYPRLMYYYHPDYLGHIEYITDLDGLPYQHFYYTAWGETLIEEKATRPGMNFDSPYRFNGKELDEETGLYYYGARYYNPTVSVWLGVDPLAKKFPHQTLYVFTDNNPIMLWDPTGMNAEEADGGGFWNKLGNLLTGHGWRTNSEIVKTLPHFYLNEITVITQKDDSNDELGFVGAVGAGLATNVKGAAELTQVEIIADSKRNGKVLNADKEACKSMGKIAKAAKFVGSALGVISFANHVKDAAHNFEEEGFSSTKGWLNIGKAGADVLFMVAKSNPLVLTYSIADAAGYLE
jgi:RHS repeat-associated protein